MLLLAIAATTLAGVPRVASYDIRAELDTTSHRLTAIESITWTNPASHPATEVWFHLYLNAFAGADSTFFRESGGWHREHSAREEGRGWTHLRRVAVDGSDVTTSVAFVSPDDGNPADRTVARLPLSAHVGPGQTIVLDIDFEAQLPRVFARTGWATDFYLLGQWFPKLGVYADGPDGASHWNCHQLHLNSEFFADFGDYRVALTVPDGWLVGATGELESRTSAGGKQTFVYAQQAVHDFAAAVARGFTDMAASFTDLDVPRPWRLQAAALLGRPPGELRLPPLKLRLLLPTRIAPLASRILLSARAAIAYYGVRYGPYPYATLTIVVPPEDGAGAGGMEYPTFCTTAGSWRDLLPPMSWQQSPEVTTIHEYGHQYFYGLLASNEAEHAWLDEGLNTFAEYRATEALRRDLAPVPDLPPFLTHSPWLAARMFLALMPPGEPIDTASWDFRDPGEYFLASYDHTALVLATCERMAGAAPFARGMRAYSDRFRFRHPGPEDFFSTMADFIAPAAAAFLRQGIERSATCDFAVDEVRSRPVEVAENAAAPAEGGGPHAPPRAHAEVPRSWESEVVVARNGELEVPVDVELTFEDGSRERVRWDGRARSFSVARTTASPLAFAAVDPDCVLLIDRNRVNNSMSVDPSPTSSRKGLLDGGGLVLAFVAALGALL